MTLAEQVALAVRQAERAPRATSVKGGLGPETYRLTPNRVAFALGWVVANAIVSAYYRVAGIDVLPSYDPTRGWDRFLITRRVSCWQCANDSADHPGSIMLDGSSAPILVCPQAGVRIALRDALSDDPEEGVRQVLERLSPPPLPQGDHSDCWHECAVLYPTLYGMVTELVLEHPGVVAARELFVDDREIAGAFHPLYLHGFVTSPRAVYDWFAIETGEYAAYVRIHGRSALYATDSGSWSTARTPLVEEAREAMKQRLCAWLRISGRPDSEGVD